MGMSNPTNNGSTISVVPRLLIRYPAIPNQRSVVFPEDWNASAPNGCVGGAFAWYFFSVFCFVLSPVTYAWIFTELVITMNEAIIRNVVVMVYFGVMQFLLPLVLLAKFLLAFNYLKSYFNVLLLGSLGLIPAVVPGRHCS